MGVFFNLKSVINISSLICSLNHLTLNLKNMRKQFLLLFLIPLLAIANESKTFEVNLMVLSSDRYNIVIKGNTSSSQTDLKQELRRKIHESCGTRFEIENIQFVNIDQDGSKKITIHGRFKCYLNSQM
mgnify:CR=1 FL=1